MTSSDSSARRTYESLVPARSPFEDRGEALSGLTVPSLFRDQAQGGFDPLSEPYQSEGSQGVLNLAARFLLTILPPNGAFAKLEVNRFELVESLRAAGLPTEDAGKIKTQTEEALNVVMQEVHSFLDTSPGLRPAAFEHFQHLIVVGNGLFEIQDEIVNGRPELRFSHHSLHDFVVERDRAGQANLVVLKEALSRANAPERALGLFMERQEEVDMYTLLERRGPDLWDVRQEINDNVVPGTIGHFTPETNPFIVGRFIPAAGEDYGRSWCEHLYGDLRSLEGLSQALVEASAAAARLIPFLDPNSGVSAKRLNDQRNGEIVTGRADSLTFANVQKQADLTFALTMEDRLSRRLGRAFLRTSSIQRDGERVTAAEIQAMTRELESAFGGVYSTIAEEFQRPLVSRVMHLMARHRMIPKLPRDLVRVGIVTGIGNLGRGRDLANLSTGLQAMGALLGPASVAQLIDMREASARILNSVGVDTRGFLRTDEEVQRMQQAAQQAEMLQTTAPELVRQGGGLVREAAAPTT